MLPAPAIALLLIFGLLLLAGVSLWTFAILHNRRLNVLSARIRLRRRFPGDSYAELGSVSYEQETTQPRLPPQAEQSVAAPRYPPPAYRPQGHSHDDPPIYTTNVEQAVPLSA